MSYPTNLPVTSGPNVPVDEAEPECEIVFNVSICANYRIPLISVVYPI